MENPMKMDDLGVPPFKETPKKGTGYGDLWVKMICKQSIATLSNRRLGIPPNGGDCKGIPPKIPLIHA